MNEQSTDAIDRLKCLFTSHKWVPNRAEDREPDGYKRIFANDEDREPEPIDACYLVDKCRRCGKGRRIYSSVDIAERHGVPLKWERSVDTEEDR